MRVTCRRMWSWIPNSIMLLPALGIGAAVTSMTLALPRREANIRRVERAMLAFWMSLAILIAVHQGHSVS